MSSGVQSWSPSLEDNDREKFRKRLLNIDSNLEDTEVEKLKFLCRDFIPYRKLEKARSALDIFEDLMTEDLLNEKDPFLLAELLYIMKQNSLLKHLNYTKEQVKVLLPTRKKVSPFRNLLYELSEDIDSESLKNMIFILKESLPKVETPTSLSFLGHLEKQAKIDADDLTLLEDLCKNVLPHLVRKTDKYKKEKEAGQKGKELLSASDINQIRQALPAGSSREREWERETETSMMGENHQLAASRNQACIQGMCPDRNITVISQFVDEPSTTEPQWPGISS
uniref:Caspase 10 n=1 Tax=Pipistrellus kuhlii TaxID=59472 RepID=A0A7J7XTF8_PIPKU|nr:caspase 10 [Pipistrellus kuhlii]